MENIEFNFDMTKGGTLPKYTDADTLIDKINDYFDSGCEVSFEIVTKDGEKISLTEKRPTVSGLALHLGFASRQSIYDYINRNSSPQLAYIIKMAKSNLARFHEERLFLDRPTGSIFWLKHDGMVEDRSQAGNLDAIQTEWDIRERFLEEDVDDDSIDALKDVIGGDDDN